jgi:gamma-glutamyltranspeptidase/glutathione hydrolase
VNPLKLRNLFVAALTTLFILGSITSEATSRHPVRGSNGVVSSSSRIASEVGVEIMKQGGNAVDAAIATAFAMAVTWPTAGNIGGGGFMIYHGADGEATAFDFREKAPLASTKTMYLNEDGSVRDNSNHDGILAVGVLHCYSLQLTLPEMACRSAGTCTTRSNGWAIAGNNTRAPGRSS